MTQQVRLLTGAVALARAAAPEVPQKDDLCGPFWALAVARAAGATVAGGQDQAALAAGTRLWDAPAETLPPGQRSRTDYQLALPHTADESHAGTDVSGVADAIHSLAPELAVTPQHTRNWDADRLATYFDEVIRRPSPTYVILNVATEQYRFARAGSEIASPWHVGHFVALLGWRDSPAGRTYVIHDSYPLRSLLGAADLDPEVIAAVPRGIRSDYLHEQSADALLAALNRPGRTPGAILLVAPAPISTADSSAPKSAPLT